MPYSTPELLQIGAAQNLVLGFTDSDNPICTKDNVDGASYDVELW